MFQAVVLGVGGVLDDAAGLRQGQSGVLRVANAAAVRAWLQPLRGVVRIALLDRGGAERMQAWAAGLGAAAWAERSVWTDDFGRDARPPRPLAWRWLARRLDVSPSACLYVAGAPDTAAAARRAGFTALVLPRPLDPGLDWDAVLGTTEER